MNNQVSISSDEDGAILLQQALEHHRAGGLQQAENLYRRVLKIYPHHPDANHNLGVLAVQVNQPKAALLFFKNALDNAPDHPQFWLSYLDVLIKTGQKVAALDIASKPPEFGNNARAYYNFGVSLQELLKINEAAASYRRSLMIDDCFAQAHANLGNVQNSLGNFDEAIKSYQRALELEPNLVEIHNSLGVVLQTIRHFGEAELSYKRALQINPNYVQALSNIGSVYCATGRIDHSIASYRRALEINPRHADTHNNLGFALLTNGMLESAIASFRNAILIQPNFALAYANMGNAFKQLRLFESALESYRRALEIKPDDADIHNNMGNALQSLGLLQDAIVCYRRALAIKPDMAMVHNNLGVALQESGNLDSAVESYKQALEIKHDFAEVHGNLGNALKDMGRLDEAVVSYRNALKIKSDFTDVYSNLLLIINGLPNQAAEFLLAEARNFGEIVAANARPYVEWSNTPDLSRSLKIGLVSGDLRNHSVGYFIEGILAALTSRPSGRLNIFVYSTHFRSDELTERIKKCCNGWQSAVGLSDENLARQIRNDKIDILIDLSGHTAYNRLPMFAWKPAPVQVTWLGYFATTGVEAIDYLVADPWTIPEDEACHFTEHIWHLPETRLCFTAPEIRLNVSKLPALTNGYVTFGCFNNLIKMNNDVVLLWSQILNKVARSRLFLKAPQLRDANVRQKTIERFGEYGIGGERIILEGFSSRSEYLEAYHRVDISLDPFPFPGGTTSVEGLWMGVPVLTMAGKRFIPRQGFGFLMNAGLHDWVAVNNDDYVNRAVLHANDLLSLSTLRKQLRSQVLASPIFDSARFAGNFESAMVGMWEKWCNK
jgi:predicted O-linked N-acetylglucosamine transferase (SPINDLY family)